MFQRIIQRILKPIRKSENRKTSQGVESDLSKLTGKDFEFILTPDDIEFPNSEFDNLMTPDSMPWSKTTRDNWTFFKVGKDEFSYSWEPPGVQMTFNAEITYTKAKQIADEVAGKLTRYLGQKTVEVHFVPTDKIIRFD